MIDFDHRGLIPPYYGKATSWNRSPYTISLMEFAKSFSMGYPEFNATKRIEILKGFLEYRSILHNTGIIQGYQWINGSFVTNKELIKHEAPNDIDVVSVFILPVGDTQESFGNKHPHVFDNKSIKNRLHVDAFYICLEPVNLDLDSLIEQVNYWNSLWSHQRESLLWKGYIKLSLAPDEDSLVNDELGKISKGVENA